MEEFIKNIFTSLGSDVCGIAGIERFETAPKGFHPTDLYSKCKSVIVFGITLPKGLWEVEPQLMYEHFNTISCSMVDYIALTASNRIEKEFKCTCVPLPCDTPYNSWDEESMTGHGLLSMKHTAVAAGIGTLGKNTLLLNEVYGNRLTVGAVLTDIELKSDPFAKSICIEGCTLCLDICAVSAINEDKVEQKKCRLNSYGKTKKGFETVDCNKCRTVCPVGKGLKRTV